MLYCLSRGTSVSTETCCGTGRRSPTVIEEYTVPALMISATLSILLLLAAPSPGRAEIFKGFPDGIVCKYGAVPGDLGGEVVFHVHSRQDDGTVIYKVFGRRPVVIRIKPDGVVDAGNIKDCHGKTVPQLREAGQAFDVRIKRSRP